MFMLFPHCRSGVRTKPEIAIFRRLTWFGHDFLDSVRDPAIWKATKEGAAKIGGFSVHLLGALAKGLIRLR
jgi:hypothetical protein